MGTRTSTRTSRVKVRSSGPSPTLLWGGVGALAVLVLVAVLLVTNGGNSAEAGKGSPPATVAPKQPTEREMNEARGLIREAREILSRANDARDEQNRAESNRLKDEARVKIEKALGIWDAMMNRIPKDEQRRFAGWEENEVRHWSLLKRQTFYTDH